MKCLCGFEQLPNNGRILAMHVQECMIDGPCKDILPLPTVVWRDGGFSVVRAAEEGEQTYDIGLVRYNFPEEEPVVLEEVIVSEETPSEEPPASEE